jgi:hypothetical protein
MPLVDKNELLKTLRSLTAFDNGSPYIAIYVDEPLTFYRSSPFGFIQSKKLSLSVRGTCVSLLQLQERLRVLPEEQVDVDLDPNGVLKISSINNTWNNELRVHTVKHEQAGLKTHTIGDVKMKLDPSLFSGFNAKPFPVVAFPSLTNGIILLPTVYGIIIWQGPEELKKIQLQPRDTFLKFLSPSVEEIYLTEKGYWGASTDSLLTFVGTHNVSDILFKLYNVAGTKLVSYPADRLCYALNAAASIVSGNIELTGQEVRVKDNHGLTSKFGVGGAGDTKFTIYTKTAKLIVDALEQTKEDEITLYSVNVGNHPTMRLERGNWAVSFKTF